MTKYIITHMVVHLVTFATKEYIHSAYRLRHSALLNGVDQVHIYTENDIKSFIDNHSDIFKFKKGFGCYSWQPYVLLDTFLKINQNDTIIYCDSGIQIIGHLKPIIDLCEKYKSLFFNVGEHKIKDYKNKYWSKDYIFKAMDCDSDKYRNAYQTMGGFQVYKKNDFNFNFIKELLKFCSDKLIVTDTLIEDFPNDPGFKEHRHNQSVLTNLVTKFNLKTFRSPGQYGIKDNVPDSNYNLLLNIHRQKLKPSLKIVVITPTTGDPQLERCIKSVQKQDYNNVEHHIVIDGPDFYEKAQTIIDKFKNKNEITVTKLAKNTGANGWICHRIYGAFSYLVDADYICFLDEDNWIEKNHISSLLYCILYGKLDWAYTLRNICKDGKFITKDNCESLGNLSHTILNKNDYLVDTSSYMVKPSIARQLTYSWNVRAREPGKMEGDRRFFYELNKHFPNYSSTCKYTLNYTVGNNTNSVRGEFFIKGNELMKKNFNGVIPWDKLSQKTLYIVHFNKEKTNEYLFIPKINKNKSYSFDDWQLSLLDKFKENYILKNAYTEQIPPGSYVLVNMCNPESLPSILNRKDIIKVLYTAEGPNIRHKQQWDYNFLKRYFTKVFTYYKPHLEKDKNLFVYCPFLHRLHLDRKIDHQFLLKKDKIDKSVCFVGENRALKGEYTINETKLNCLDYLRNIYASSFKNIKLYGNGWKNPCETKWGRQQGHSINIIKNYTFCMIIENCDAPGYTSEKIYDALCAGTIPLYYGNAEGLVPDEFYINLKNIKPENIQSVIDNMTEDEIKQKLEYIYENREEMLRKVSPVVYYNTFKKTFDF